MAAMVAKSASRVARLCTGAPSAVCLVASLASAEGEHGGGRLEIRAGIELLVDTDRRSVKTADPRADSLLGMARLAREVSNQSRTGPERRAFVPPVLAVRPGNSST